MIVKEMGDLLETKADVICHQVNAQGAMGTGVALAIRNRMMPSTYRKYVNQCALFDYHAEKLLGTVMFLSLKDGRQVANCFSQNGWSDQADLTNYDALRSCLNTVELYASTYGWSVALPGFMGCGIAGGDWNKVYQIIEEVFGESPVQLTIYYRI